MMDSIDTPSTRPYLIRALYEWCTDNGFTPFVAVRVDESVRVPMEYVKDGEIVLNVSLDVTSALKLGNDYLAFKGRFGGIARDILVPITRVLAIYARENGQGMAFPVSPVVRQESPSKPVDAGGERASSPVLASVEVGAAEDGGAHTPPKPVSPAGRPTLMLIK